MKSPFIWAFALALILAAALSVRVGTRDERVASTCSVEAPKKGDSDRERERERQRDRGEHRKGGSEVGGLFSGPQGNEALEKCDKPGHPETFDDLAKANSSRMTRQVAPGTQIKPGAQRAAVRHAKALPTIGNAWAPLGKTPLIANRTEYDQTLGSTQEGFVGLAGRTNAFARDPGSGAIYAAVSNGGIWKSTDNGGSWSSIADNLPTQVVSGIAWSSAGGGTLLVLTGDRAFGGDTYAGLGVYRSTDEGKTWTHSSGVPDGLLGFRIVVDPNNPRLVYAATGGGLFRSTDGGASFDNVNLPTGKNHPEGTPDCSGEPPTVKDCFLANMVTDVVVQGPANANTSGDDAKPGAVLAAVGWRAGTKKNADGAQQSPGNGVYRSETGAPGTFTNLDMAGNSQPTAGDPLTQGRIGRIALGAATGTQQDHRYVYALVMDAAKFNGGFTGDENLDAPNPAATDYLNGIWVSHDFGKTWQQLEGSTEIDNDPTSNSALAPPVCKEPTRIAYCPGIQAWYNLWTQPDPSEQTSAGVPTRLAFGLEEVWANPSPDPSGLDGSSPKKFEVIGRYYGNKACTPLLITNDLPVCPAASGGTPPPTTTHPDQHAALWIPDGGSGGGVTLFVANDGGVYKQHAAAGEPLDNAKWGAGNNDGLHTLQPYDAEMAKDGTVYMGLQDNGEAKIDPDGSSYTIYGGDGFFTAVDPDNSNVAYEEYVGGDMSVTTDGGKNWNDIQPDALTSAQFTTPFQMDPANSRHLMIGGRDVEETMDGPDTNNSSWTKVFDLGTQKHPGSADATAADDDPDNQLSAVDLRSFPRPSGAGTGPPTPDSTFSGGDDTTPYPVGSVLGNGTDLPPGTYDDHPFTVGADAGNASMTVRITWPRDTNDWDLFLYTKDADGTLHPAGSSASGSTTEEQIVIENPTPGDYVARVANFQAAGSYDGKVTFAAPPPGGTAHGPPTAAYVGYCGFCDTITQGTPFANGIATNVGSGPGEAVNASGWHIARAAGLPSRYITSVQMDPSDPRTVYATLAGYGRRWAFPGAVGEDTSKVGKGHVFKSMDGGETFTDVTGDLPDTPANWSVLHNGHLVVGTDIGVFESCDASGGSYSRLGSGLPAVPISTLRLKPGDPDLLVAATYGRGVYTYRFGDDNGRCAPKPGSPGFPGNAGGGPKVCAAAHGFKSARVVPRRRGLRFVVKRRVKSKYNASLFRKATLRRTTRAKTVARFKARKGSFTWHGSRKLRAGYYVAQVRVRSGKTFDLRRFPVLLKRGKFHRLHAYWGRASCKLLRIVRLSGPAFGGRTQTSLLISFRTPRSGHAVVTVRRGSRVVKRYKPFWKGARTVRRRLRSLHLRRGTYSVTVAARAGKSRQTVTLYARRI